MDRDGALLGTLRELLEQLLPPNEPDAPPADEPREEEDTPPPREENAASDTDSVPDLASASSSSLRFAPGEAAGEAAAAFAFVRRLVGGISRPRNL